MNYHLFQRYNESLDFPPKAEIEAETILNVKWLGSKVVFKFSNNGYFMKMMRVMVENMR